VFFIDIKRHALSIKDMLTTGRSSLFAFWPRREPGIGRIRGELATRRWRNQE
jgi:hypothetical protein